MKTSFYFVLWIGIYWLIFAFGGPSLRENAFVFALIAVYAIGMLCNKLLARQIQYSNECAAQRFMEMVYRDDYAAYKRIYLRQLVFNTLSFIYLAMASASLLFLGFDNFPILAFVIFALFAFSAGRSMVAARRAYNDVRDAGRIVPENIGIGFPEALAAYSANRATHPAGMFIPGPTIGDRLYRGASVVLAVLSCLVGTLFVVIGVLGMLSPYTHHIMALIDCTYGGLAVIYGINDLINSIRHY